MHNAELINLNNVPRAANTRKVNNDIKDKLVKLKTSDNVSNHL